EFITSIAGVQRNGQGRVTWRWVGHFIIPGVFYFVPNFDRLLVLCPRLNSGEIDNKSCLSLQDWFGYF
ncbi:MAG: hypothetical protein U9Q05_06890, partial [Thermodesulfobacteriota bacterium]|nr:hypothetical protein [Thermodesulfobacteriota bacterium]